MKAEVLLVTRQRSAHALGMGLASQKVTSVKTGELSRRCWGGGDTGLGPRKSLPGGPPRQRFLRTCPARTHPQLWSAQAQEMGSNFNATNRRQTQKHHHPARKWNEEISSCTDM